MTFFTRISLLGRVARMMFRGGNFFVAVWEWKNGEIVARVRSNGNVEDAKAIVRASEICIEDSRNAEKVLSTAKNILEQCQKS